MRQLKDIGWGGVAQLGERCVRNAETAGSNPVVSILYGVPKPFAQKGFWPFYFISPYNSIYIPKKNCNT